MGSRETAQAQPSFHPIRCSGSLVRTLYGTVQWHSSFFSFVALVQSLFHTWPLCGATGGAAPGTDTGTVGYCLGSWLLLPCVMGCLHSVAVMSFAWPGSSLHEYENWTELLQQHQEAQMLLLILGLCTRIFCPLVLRTWLRYPQTCFSLPQLLGRSEQIENLPNTPRYSLLVLSVEAVPISQVELHFLLPLTLHASDDKVNSVGTDGITTYGQLC